MCVHDLLHTLKDTWFDCCCGSDVGRGVKLQSELPIEFVIAHTADGSLRVRPSACACVAYNWGGRAIVHLRVCVALILCALLCAFHAFRRAPV